MATPTTFGGRLWTARMRAAPSWSMRLMTPASASSSSTALAITRPKRLSRSRSDEIDAERHAAGLDGLDAAELSIAQDDGRGGALRGPAQLAAEQPQLGTHVALGGDLAREIHQGSQAAILVAQHLVLLLGRDRHGLA